MIKTQRNKQTVIASVSVMLLLGLYYSWSVFANALVSNNHWSNADAMLPFTVCAFVYSLSMLFAGLLYQRFGARRIICLCSVSIGIGLMGASFFFRPLPVAIFFGVFCGGGTAGCYNAALSTVLCCNTPKKRSVASGLVTGAYGLAAFYFAPLANRLISYGGVPFALRTLGIVMLPLLLFIGCLIAPPEGIEAIDEAASAAEGFGAPDSPLKATMRSRTFYKILGISLFGTASGGIIITNVANVASALGDVKNPFIFASVASIFNCVGRLVGGYLGDIFPRKKLLIFVFSGETALLLCFRFLHSPAAIAAGVALISLAYGTLMAIQPILLVDHFGIKYQSQNYGAMVASGCVYSFIGPQFAAKLADITSSFNMSFLLCVFYGILTVLLLFALPKPPQKTSAIP